MQIPHQLPVLSEILDRMNIEALELVLTSNVKVSQDGQYKHWDEIRYRQPPGGISREEWWAAIKYARQRESHELPLADEDGNPFTYMMPGKAWERVHKMDQKLGGQITLSEKVTNPSTRDR